MLEAFVVIVRFMYFYIGYSLEEAMLAAAQEAAAQQAVQLQQAGAGAADRMGCERGRTRTGAILAVPLLRGEPHPQIYALHNRVAISFFIHI
ncbi:hypothetical protein NQ317_013710 [Molorchus minor]|uniref:Uncharacterized protein n=1 Tax=Molorchus minor TaxID=1323400 RepID=A0ABQ9IXI8_9CUCU|nr:hypothetical protein NQ317_013710 [Molorchus minor]